MIKAAYIGAPKVSSYQPTCEGLRVRQVWRRSGGPERLMSICQASEVLHGRSKNKILFSSGGGLGTLVEESPEEEGDVVLLLA